MADKFLGKGTVSAVASGNMSPTNPASLAVDDVLMCFVAHHDNVTPTVSGWTAITDNGWPAASGTAVRIDAFWKRVTDAAESDDVVTVTRAAGDAGIAIICAFRGLTTTGNPYGAADAQANASSATCTMLSVTPTAAGQTIVFVGAHADDGAYGTISGSDPAPTERHDSLTALGLDVSLLVGTGERSVSTAVGNRTSTNVRTAVNVGGQIALTNASGGSGQNVAAGNQTVTTTAPTAASVPGNSSRAAGAQTVTVTAPTATLAANITQAAGAQAVTVSAPTATAAPSNTLTAADNTVTFTAPDAAIAGTGPQVADAGDLTLTTTAPTAALAATATQAAGDLVLTLTAPTMTVASGGATVTLGAPLIALTAPAASITAGDEPEDDFWCGSSGLSGRSGGDIHAGLPVGICDGYRYVHAV